MGCALAVLFLNVLMEVATENNDSRKALFSTYENMYFPYIGGETFVVATMVQCSHRCLASSIACLGANFNTILKDGRHECEIVHITDIKAEVETRSQWTFMETKLMVLSIENRVQDNMASCKVIKKHNDSAVNGIYVLNSNGRQFSAYCDMANGGFTLIARFSNADQNNWMVKSGELWYTNDTFGNVNSSDHNGDMVNLAFSLVNGSDIKVSRSDDNAHTALLLSTGCLEEESFRKKVTSFGDFRYGSSWQANKCLGSCNASFSGMYATTSGFNHATSACTSSDDILDGYHIGFWCHFGTGDGSVLMIGGGGKSCSRADHGIGITESNTPNFSESFGQIDFGNDADASPTTNYALNLWIR